MKQVWACTQCRSINDPRASRCYKCLTPRDLVKADPMSLSATPSGETHAPLPLPPYEPATIRAVVAAALIGAATVFYTLNTIYSGLLVQQILAERSEISVAQEQFMSQMSLLGLGAAIGALVAFALWLSKAVAAMPALGLGYTRVTPKAVILETIIPVYDFFRVPPIIRDLMRRLDPTSGRAGILIAGAWFGLVLGFFVPRVGAIFVGVSDGISGASFDELVMHSVYLVHLSTALYIVAGVSLIGIIWWVESKTRAVARARWDGLDQEAALA